MGDILAFVEEQDGMPSGVSREVMSVAAELAIRDPDRYGGALLMSPGTTAPSKLSHSIEAKAVTEQRYIVTYGEAETRANVERAHRTAQELLDLGANVTLLAYPELGHTLPHDYWAKLPHWLAFLLDRIAEFD